MKKVKLKRRGVARTALLYVEKILLKIVKVIMKAQGALQNFRMKFYMDIDRQAIAWAEEARKQKKGMYHINGYFIISISKRSAIRRYYMLAEKGALKRWPNE